MRILDNQWKCLKGIAIFSVQQNKVVCRPEDCYFFQANGVIEFGDLNSLFSYLE